ncbi:MAG: hypothetical protein HKN64_04445 [Woeseiaceae bacterium]|nr:hypothetical protein [Woeseiaceae bacterium]
MKSRALIALAAVSCVAACNRQPPAENVPTEDAAVEAPAKKATVVEKSPPAAIEFDQAFIDHMHVHAERMDEMMFALADGDLVAAGTPAYWLSRHPADDRIPKDWLTHLESMREEARQVEMATDLETARAAAERITIHCQGCHAAAGVDSTD